MAKKQSFEDKAKKKKGDSGHTVKLIKASKTSRGTYKFNEKFVRVNDMNKIAEEVK